MRFPMKNRTPKAPTPEAKLLLLASTKGYENRMFIEAAERLGLPYALGTDRCHRLEDPWHDGALPLHFEQPEEAARAIVDFARAQPLRAVVPIGDEAVRTAAAASRALGLPHNPPEAAAACRNKFLARQKLAAAGLPVPRFARFALTTDPRRAAAEVSYPCVLKPLSLSGSQGVMRADTPEEFVAAFERIARLLERPQMQARREKDTDGLLAEDFIPGREVSLEGLMNRGRLRVLALFDKPDPLDGPTFEETLYVTPSRLPAETQQGVAETAERAAAVLGLIHGPMHAELRLSPAGPRVVEVAARAIGGLCARALRFRTGMSLPELILRHACGLPVETLEREAQASGVMMLPIPQGGVFGGAEGEEAARAVPGVTEVTITAKVGHRLEPLPEGSSYLGFVFARAATPEEVEQALRRAHASLHFRFTPELPVTR